MDALMTIALVFPYKPLPTRLTNKVPHLSMFSHSMRLERVSSRELLTAKLALRHSGRLLDMRKLPRESFGIGMEQAHVFF